MNSINEQLQKLKPFIEAVIAAQFDTSCGFCVGRNECEVGMDERPCDIQHLSEQVTALKVAWEKVGKVKVALK